MYNDLCQLSDAQSTFNSCEDLHGGLRAIQSEKCVLQSKRTCLFVALTNMQFFTTFVELNWLATVSGNRVA